MRIFILSERKLLIAPGRDFLLEFENIIADTCQAEILQPARTPIYKKFQNIGIAKKILSKLSLELTQLNIKVEGPNVLLLISSNHNSLYSLRSINNWRKFDIVAAYIGDCWLPQYFPEFTNKLDHLFVPFPEMVEPIRERFKVPVNHIPYGANVLEQGSPCAENRPIDVMSFGRSPAKYHGPFSKMFNRRDSGYLYYRHHSYRDVFNPSSEDYQKSLDYRNLFFQLLRRSKIVLNFDTVTDCGSVLNFPSSFITNRWFESASAGCAIVGKLQSKPSTNKIFGWEDAVIDIPDEPSKAVDFVKDLLTQKERLAKIHKRNYLNCLEHHDWRYRIQDILACLKIPVPEQLSAICSKIKSEASSS